MSREVLIWIFFAAALAISFVLSGLEAGVFGLSRVRIRQQMRAGRHSARLLHGYLENPENFLWTILVGNTAANFFIFGWIIYLLHGLFREQRLWFVFIFSILVLLFYTFFDLLPKMLFRGYPNRLCLMFVRPFRFLHLLLRPVVWMVEGVSAWLLRRTGGRAFTRHVFGNREELRFVMQESAQGFSTEERAMINRVLDLPSVTVRRVAQPFARCITADSGSTLAQVFDKCREHQFTRLPVWEHRDGQRRIAGIVSLNALMFENNLDRDRPLAEFVRPALYLDEDLRLEDAFRRMQRSGQRMAIVLGRDRREIGIVTLEDVLKVVFGEVNL